MPCGCQLSGLTYTYIIGSAKLKPPPKIDMAGIYLFMVTYPARMWYVVDMPEALSEHKVNQLAAEQNHTIERATYTRS